MENHSELEHQDSSFDVSEVVEESSTSTIEPSYASPSNNNHKRSRSSDEEDTGRPNKVQQAASSSGINSLHEDEPGVPEDNQNTSKRKRTPRDLDRDMFPASADRQRDAERLERTRKRARRANIEVWGVNETSPINTSHSEAEHVSSVDNTNNTADETREATEMASDTNEQVNHEGDNNTPETETENNTLGQSTAASNLPLDQNEESEEDAIPEQAPVSDDDNVPNGNIALIENGDVGNNTVINNNDSDEDPLQLFYDVFGSDAESITDFGSEFYSESDSDFDLGFHLG